jgi:outer membrane protein insertion porin family
VYSVSYTEPYWTIDGVSRGFDVYHRNVDPTSLSVGNYKTSSTGGGLRLGLPIADDDSVSLGLSYDVTSVTTDSTSPVQYQGFVNRFGETNTTLLSSVGWARDGRDSFTWPTKGSYHRVTGELALPGGDLTYVRGTYQYQRYFPIGKDYTLLLNGEAGYAQGYSGKPLPFFKNFYVGGIGSVRGFETASLGPRLLNTDGTASKEALGGNRKLVGNAEFLMPMPGMGQDRSVRLGAFVDGGQVWGGGENASLGDIRFSTGVSVSWNSPMGPLKFSIAQPLNKKPEDNIQRFQFQFGSTF